MNSDAEKNHAKPDAMTDPARRDGGGHDAASALALHLVHNATIDEEIGHRLRQSFGGDTEACAALKLGVSVTAVRRACRSGRPGARIMRRVCLVYSVDGTWLLTGEGSPARSGPPADALPSETLLHEVSRRLSAMIAALESARSARTPMPGEATGSPTSTVNAQGQDWL